MHHYEQEDAPRGDEMNGARRLPPAEDVEEKWEARVHAGRHCKSGRQHQREQQEHHDEVGELLQDVVALGLLALGEFEPEVFPDRGANMLELAALRNQVAGDMPAAEAIDEVDEPVDDKEPRKEK